MTMVVSMRLHETGYVLDGLIDSEAGDVEFGTFDLSVQGESELQFRDDFIDCGVFGQCRARASGSGIGLDTAKEFVGFAVEINAFVRTVQEGITVVL